MARELRPKYRIVEAAERAGIGASTLRAWERRYGIPRPARTDSGYRLYSEIDLRSLSRMKDLVSSGMAAHEAAEQVLREQRGAKALPFANADTLRDRLLDAACVFDGATLERVLTEVTHAYAAEEAVLHVLAPALVELGDRWADGRIGVAHEHWLVQRLRAHLASLVAGMRARPLRGVAVVACFPDEEHDVACYVVAVHLAARGLRPVVLGARTPPEALAVAVRDLSPAMVCLSLTNPATAADRRAVAAYKTACAGRPLWVGGQGVASLGALPRGVRSAGIGAQDLLATLRSPRTRGSRKSSGSRKSRSNRASSPPAP
ncbi:MAG: MerR family transcriptional regulator [Myxococcota bacterium]